MGTKTPIFASATKVTDVTPHDTNDNKYDAIYIGTGGDIVVHPKENDAGVNITFTALSAGYVLPIAVDKILSTGTSASDIKGLEW